MPTKKPLKPIKKSPKKSLVPVKAPVKKAVKPPAKKAPAPAKTTKKTHGKNFFDLRLDQIESKKRSAAKPKEDTFIDIGPVEEITEDFLPEPLEEREMEINGPHGEVIKVKGGIVVSFQPGPLLPPPVQKEVYRRTLAVQEEASKHITSLKALRSADVNVESAAMAFRTEVIKAGMTMVDDIFDKIVESAKKTYDDARDERNKARKPYEDADAEIRAVMATYLGMLTRQRNEEQKRAEKDQADREIQAVKQREQERLRVKAEVDRQLAELPADAPDELFDKIQAKLEEFEGPMPVAPKIQISAPETSKQMTVADNWKARVIDISKVVEQVVSGDLPISLMDVRMPEANRLAKLHQDKKSFPGLEFYNEPFARGIGGRR